MADLAAITQVPQYSVMKSVVGCQLLVVRKLMLFCFFLFTLSTHLLAQNYSSVKNASKKTLAAWKDAADLIAREDYPEATDALLNLTQSEPKFIDGWLMLGELYNEQKEFDKGRSALLEVMKLDPAYASKSWFFLAQSYWNLDSFYACANACDRFLQFQTISKERQQQALQMKRNSLFASESIKHPVPFDPKNLGGGINSEQPEYLPSVTGDEQTIVFTRRLGKGPAANEDFFISRKMNGAWTPAVPLSGNVNTLYNEGAQSLTPDGNELYYAACDKPGGYGSCDIYFTQRKGKDWSDVKDVGPPVCTNAWETQPCIGADGNTLYFVSNRPGGKGGSDIWVSYKGKNGKWQLPINLGDSINTQYDEKSPFIHPDGVTLYFSSKGHPGFGGDDIFISRRKSDGTWSTPKNIGYPINSRNDENSLVVSLNGQHAYFASDRLSDNRNYDLYYFDLYKEAQPLSTTFLKGIVTNADDATAVAANIQLIDLETGMVVGESDADPVDGSYLVSIPNGKDYALNAAATGFLFYSQNFSLKDHPAEKPFLINVEMKPIAVNVPVVLHNIFFETDSYVLKDESKVELNKLLEFLNQNPSLKILISGHTDNQGSDEHNQKLSDDRAKSVKDYLVSNGIAATRLSSKGFGETKPIATNDTPEGRAQNRRTEFTVIAN